MNAGSLVGKASSPVGNADSRAGNAGSRFGNADAPGLPRAAVSPASRAKLQLYRYTFVAAVILLCLSGISSSAQGPRPAPDRHALAKNASGSGWSMRSHDVRRTGRTDVSGPQLGNNVWRYVAEDGLSINIEPAVTQKGVFFGTWGLVRKYGNDKTKWDKSDGELYGLDRFTGKELWKPLNPELCPYAYKYDGRPVTRQDRPAGPGLHLNWYNGTIEGTPAVDPVTGILYVGRGDGYLYAVDPKTGKVAWKFLTIDPARPDDPEGGGEIVGGPLVTPDGIIVFATFAAPPSPKPPHKLRHETNAVYAINRSGKMLWRYPATGSTPNAFNAPPALSPDGSRVYAVTALVGPSSTSQLVAIDRLSGALLWELPLPNSGGQDLACGKNGVIYVAGMSKKGFGWRPAGFAVKDDGKTGSMFWGPVELDDHMQKTHMTGGVALYETEDNVQDVFMSTTIMKNLNTAGGQLHRLDPATGRITSSWDPKKASPACPGGLTDVSLDKDRTIYVGVRGQRPKVRGRMYALKLDKGEYRVLWSHQLDAQIDWASPAIGPDGGLFFGSTDTIGPFQMLKHFATKPADSLKNIPDADPVFYGIRDKSL